MRPCRTRSLFQRVARRVFTVWNKFRLRMMLLCSVDLLYYSLIGLAIYHFIGEL